MYLKIQFLIIFFSIITLSSCDPVPRRTLNNDEKAADLEWVYSIFGENYAPLDYKQKRLNFNFEQLKKETLDKSKTTQNNDEFYTILYEFISHFEDAHTSGALTNSSLPNRAQIAYLGFSGKRVGDFLLVEKILPTIDEKIYPIKKGDKITKMDGLDLKSKINSELLKYRNLGFNEANFTFHMNKLFTRVSTQNGLPSLSESQLTVVRDDKTFDLTLPWIKKDLAQFQKDQIKKSDANDKNSEENYMMVSSNGEGSPLFKFRFLSFNGKVEYPFFNLNQILNSNRKTFLDAFKVLDLFATWEIFSDQKTEEKEPTGLELIKKTRNVPENAIYLDHSETYPAYVSMEKTFDLEGKTTKNKVLVGTILLDTFSPIANQDAAFLQFKQTLKDMKNLGVKYLIIDLIDNGGGSLKLGTKMAQALFSKKLDLPKIQFRLSDSWLDQFEKEVLSGQDDVKREITKRMLNEMIDDQKGGQRLSKAYPLDSLFPYEAIPSEEDAADFTIALQVNEMCASMCDIFSAILQDNNAAIIVGTRTLGAGGNVVGYNQSPNAHFDVRQTESLMLRKDGSYIENNGIAPDVLLNVSETAIKKYDDVRKATLKALLKETI